MNNRVSIIQFQPSLANPGENVRKLTPLIQNMPESHLAVLPELSNSGYNFRDRDEALSCAETIGEKGIFQDFILETAASKKMYIITGINEREGDVLYNSAILAGPEGILGRYRKIHLFMNEKDIFQRGDAGLPVFDLGTFRVGIQICFDYLFPEPWRILAQNGADLVCHPSNLLTKNAQICLPGLSLMNRIFIATANRTGTEGDLTFNGSSMFTGPTGQTSIMASNDKTEIISQEINVELSRNKMITRRNHVFDDRRPEIYHP